MALVAVLWLTACGGTPQSTSPGASKTDVVQTQSAENGVVTLRVSPATFGYNRFSVTVKDTKGMPVGHASVEIFISMLDMNMGTEPIKLKPPGGASSGQYTGGGELSMAGRWQVSVKVALSQNTPSFSVNFRFSVTYS